jgi:hypothetical protein
VNPEESAMSEGTGGEGRPSALRQVCCGFPLMLGLVLLAVLIGSGVWYVYDRFTRLERNVDELKRRVDQLENRR